jgi:hypothetical protein
MPGRVTSARVLVAHAGAVQVQRGRDSQIAPMFLLFEKQRSSKDTHEDVGEGQHSGTEDERIRVHCGNKHHRSFIMSVKRQMRKLVCRLQADGVEFTSRAFWISNRATRSGVDIAGLPAGTWDAQVKR